MVRYSSRCAVLGGFVVLPVLIAFPIPSAPFSVPLFGKLSSNKIRQSPDVLHVSSTNDSPSAEVEEVDDDEISELLQSTPRAYLESLCQQFNLSGDGTKEVLLQRLRSHAEEEAAKERERLLARKQRVEAGSDDERERFEFMEGDNEDDQDEGSFFYYYDSAVAVNETASERNGQNRPKQPTNKQGYITVPPPPPVEPDLNGERVVTVYSTTGQNDLTGVAASQPGQATAIDPMTSAMPEPNDAPWDANNPQKRDTSRPEIERAEEEVTELVRGLLATTGLPAFQEDDDDVDDQLASLGVVRRRSLDGPSSTVFAGFDPATVPSDTLTQASQSLRTNRGKVLQDVLRKFELNAIGHDGAFGDNVDKGGGHYRQVSKVRSFLEGFRQAEVRRISRETATLLLDKLVCEGIEGLDVALASMVRSGDDTSEEGGELNDSLLDYLTDSIRQQEKKVEQLADSAKKVANLETTSTHAKESEDLLDRLWTVDSDGVETFDPNVPETRKILRKESEKEGNRASPEPILPRSAPEKLLLLLRLLRERVKTEAAFSHDEKALNLRVLSYALNLDSDDQRRELLLKELGSSFERFDSFKELLASSIEYASSTSHQLQPSKKGSLSVKLLEHIYELTEEVRKKQSWKASGINDGRLLP